MISHESSRMNTNQENIIYKELSYKIVGLAMEVYNELGYGFLEKVYENSMMVLFERERIPVRQQAGVPVYFEQRVVGEYVADIIVEDKVIIEIKSASGIADAHRAQVLNYLKATNMRLGIIINFGKKRLEYERLAN